MSVNYREEAKSMYQINTIETAW